MNWAAIDFDWNHVRAFLATAEEGSLSAAARALRQTQPTLGRQVAALEAELGVSLFDRVGRRLSLTPAGADLLAQCRAMGEAAARISLTATGVSESIEGTIRITASELYAAEILPPLLASLRAAHPRIRLEIVASNDRADLRRREADIAIRNVAPSEPDLIARRLPDDEGGLFATPAYLAQLPALTRPADLAAATFLGFDDNAALIAELNAQGVPVDESNFSVATGTSHFTHWALMRAGLGIGVGPVSSGAVDQTLVRLFPEALQFVFPVWLVAAQELRTSARVRVVFDHLAEGLRTRRRGLQNPA
ncbi:MAG: LysR family transcriptional regulator [Pseudomonadota bacterium]